VTPDGEVLMFSSTSPQTAHDTKGFRQFYLYSASTDSVKCISCPPNGATPTADASVDTFRLAQKRGTSLVRILSSDGRRAFFNSPDALVPGDTNGQLDVYEYSDGEQHLISPGTGAFDSLLMDATPDGSDVVFATRQRISAWDDDTALDLYVARAEGMPFPEPPPARIFDSCEGEGCQALPSRPPAIRRSGSSFSQDVNGGNARPCRAVAGKASLAKQAAARARQKAERLRREGGASDAKAASRKANRLHSEYRAAQAKLSRCRKGGSK
jgi:hypothetical protein